MFVTIDQAGQCHDDEEFVNTNDVLVDSNMVPANTLNSNPIGNALPGEQTPDAALQQVVQGD